MLYTQNVEADVICLVLLIGVRILLNGKARLTPARRLAFGRIIDITMVMCIADMASCLLDGRDGMRAWIYAANILYIGMLMVVCVLWLSYVSVRIGDEAKARRKTMLLWSVPAILFLVLLLSTPFTHLIFTVNEQNLYVRGPLIWLHWCAEGLYLLVTTLMICGRIRAEKNLLRRHRLYPLFTFLIFPVICGVVQIFVYGISATQVGITLSTILVAFATLEEQVAKDELTGLNNRRSFDEYMDDKKGRFYLLMCDVNGFKKINDSLGHLIGDHALKDMASAMRRACGRISGSLFLCRYGGDEFVVVGFERDESEIDALKNTIREELDAINRQDDRPYLLETSIGHAVCYCDDYEDVEHLIRVADENMYEDKKRLGAIR